jgi:sugar O-acyltransferase (sialic acid O-acetyltransferase NeuD family)
MTMNRILIVGAGGYGRSVADALLCTGTQTLAGFVDDRWPQLQQVWTVQVLGTLTDLPRLRGEADAVVIAIGNNAGRRHAFLQALAAGFAPATVVHPSATVSPRAFIGAGVTVMANAVIGCDAHIGEGVIVNAGAIVDHDAKLSAFSHVGVGACLAGAAELGDEAWLQEGCTLGPGQKVPAGVTVLAPRPQWV